MRRAAGSGPRWSTATASEPLAGCWQGRCWSCNDAGPTCGWHLVHAARAAAAGRDERSRIDPLPAAAEILLAAYEAETDAAVAAQKLLSVFSSLPSGRSADSRLGDWFNP